MATIRFEGTDAHLPDNTRIYETCVALGVAFGCTEGNCGTCICTVVQGMENLSPKNEKEEDMGLEDEQRLACQCVIQSGLVELRQD